MPTVLILEDDQRVAGVFLAQLEKEPVEVVVASTAAEALRSFKRENPDIIALDGVAPSEEGQEPSLVGPELARKFRQMGFEGPIIATSSEPEAQSLIKEWANKVLPHRVYVYDKLDPDSDLPGLIRELLEVYHISK